MKPGLLRGKYPVLPDGNADGPAVQVTLRDVALGAAADTKAEAAKLLVPIDGLTLRYKREAIHETLGNPDGHVWARAPTPNKVLIRSRITNPAGLVYLFTSRKERNINRLAA